MTATQPVYRTRQIITAGIIIKRDGVVVMTATTPRQMRLARFLVRGE